MVGGADGSVDSGGGVGVVKLGVWVCLAATGWS